MKTCKIPGCTEPTASQAKQAQYCARHRDEIQRENHYKSEMNRKRSKRKPNARAYNTMCREETILPPTTLDWLKRINRDLKKVRKAGAASYGAWRAAV